jgi:hypothetical protein
MLIDKALASCGLSIHDTNTAFTYNCNGRAVKYTIIVKEVEADCQDCALYIDIFDYGIVEIDTANIRTSTDMHNKMSYGLIEACEDCIDDCFN